MWLCCCVRVCARVCVLLQRVFASYETLNDYGELGAPPPPDARMWWRAPAKRK